MTTNYPGFVSAWNHLALSSFQPGDADGAIAAADHAVSLKPDRLFTMIQRVRIGFLCGHDEDRSALDRFVSDPPADGDALPALAELPAMLGRDQDLLSVCRSGAAKKIDGDTSLAMLEHLEADALARTGDSPAAFDGRTP